MTIIISTQYRSSSQFLNKRPSTESHTHAYNPELTSADLLTSLVTALLPAPQEGWVLQTMSWGGLCTAPSASEPHTYEKNTQSTDGSHTHLLVEYAWLTVTEAPPCSLDFWWNLKAISFSPLTSWTSLKPPTDSAWKINGYKMHVKHEQSLDKSTSSLTQLSDPK